MASDLVAALIVSTLFGCGLSLVFPPDVFQDELPTPGEPMMINLRRESVPVRRQGKIVSFRTTYSGLIGVGGPIPQQFRVVFDTGSGHVVIPAATCDSEACLAHERFNMTASQSAVPINADGRRVPTGELCDQVDISFGTGKITGEFVRDKVCLGFPSSTEEGHELSSQEPNGQTCLQMSVMMAVKMSTQPFKAFNFDGILGLGLASLAISDDFSFFSVLTRSGRMQSAHFGVFLTEGDVEGEESEIALGGYNKHRFLNPLAWTPVAMADFGYWQVRILAVRIDGQELDVCRDGTCRGVVDTGTSHLGVPAPHNLEVASLLGVDAGELLDCRLARAPVVEIELESINLTLRAENYMRRLPLREGVHVGSARGVDILANGSSVPSSAPINATSSPVDESPVDDDQTKVARNCTPRIMAVNMPEPVGPKLFILGEPVLHRYYTVYDWKGLQVGFSLANTHRNNPQPGVQIADARGALPNEVDKLLMQQDMVKSFHRAAQNVINSYQHDEDLDQVLFAQLKVSLKIRSGSAAA